LKTLIVLGALSLASCSTRIPVNEVVTATDVIRVTASLITDNKKQFSITMDATNLRSESIFFYLSEAACSKGGVSGRIRPARMFTIGERHINLDPRETKPLKFSCIFASKQEKGDYQVSIGSVYSSKDEKNILPYSLNIVVKNPERGKDSW